MVGESAAKRDESADHSTELLFGNRTMSGVLEPGAWRGQSRRLEYGLFQTSSVATLSGPGRRHRRRGPPVIFNADPPCLGAGPPCRCGCARRRLVRGCRRWRLCARSRCRSRPHADRRTTTGLQEFSAQPPEAGKRLTWTSSRKAAEQGFDLAVHGEPEKAPPAVTVIVRREARRSDIFC
jgi:hypothetical protein